MRVARTLDDVNVILREISNQLEKLRTGNIDMTGRRVINAGSSVKESDYVTRKELVELEKKMTELIKTSASSETGA
jgi:acetate kinase